MEITTEKILREEIKDLTAELDEAKSELEHALEKWRIAQGTAMERRKRIKELEQILDACEAANAKHLARIDHLESVYWKHWGEREELKQLCRDMYETMHYLFEWIDALTIASYGEEAEEYKGKRLTLYEQLEVPPIVRCKDCKWFNAIKEECFAHWEEGITEGIAFSATPDCFCAWGEPRERGE